MKRSQRTAAMGGILIAVLGVVREHHVAAQQRADMHNMQLVGFDDLQARSAYQPVIHKQGTRWIAYVGHHGGQRMNSLTGKNEWSGTSVVDVTDPRAPQYLAHIPGAPGEAEAGGASMVRICDGADLPRGA